MNKKEEIKPSELIKIEKIKAKNICVRETVRLSIRNERIFYFEIQAWNIAFGKLFIYFF